MKINALADQIILQISNNSASVVRDFEIFVSNYNLKNENSIGRWDENGNFTINDITISSLTEGISYMQILNSLRQDSFSGGAIFLKFIAGISRQVEDVYSIISQNPVGKTMKLKPFKDPYQLDKGITFNSVSFNIDSLTKFIWHTIYPSTVFQITIFSANIIEPSIALGEQSVKNNFNKPRALTNFLRAH